MGGSPKIRGTVWGRSNTRVIVFRSPCYVRVFVTSLGFRLTKGLSRVDIRASLIVQTVIQ